MPLYNPNPTTVPSPGPIVTTPVVETASVYQNTNERFKVIPHIEGNTWTVEYYGRLVGDMDPATLDTDIEEETITQFQLIKNMEIRVTQELQQFTDQQTQTSTLQGQANMYSIVIPIIGDVFLAPMGDGTWGKFTITSTERQSMYKVSAWAVTYTLAAYMTQEVIDNLNGKVVTTLVFDLKGINETGGALATLSEHERTVLKKKYIKDMVDIFYENYYLPTIRSFFYNGEDGYVYDPYVVDFWNYFINNPEFSIGHDAPHQFDTRGAIFKTEYVTVWDAIKKQNRAMFSRVVYAMQELPSGAFQLPYVNFTFYSNGIQFIVHPYAVEGIAVTAHEDVNNDPYSPYVFTENFYNNSNVGQTPVEIQVQKLIDQIIPAFSDIKPLYEEIPNLSHIEKFYRIPIVIALLSVCR
jgi:hypothetical protein